MTDEATDAAGPDPANAADPDSASTRPHPVEPVGDAEPVTQRLGGAPGLLVGVDFDGTLAPIADSPETPTITPDNERALSAIAAHDRAAVAVISGRELADLYPRVDVDGAVYAGNHGLELADADADPADPDAVTVAEAAERHRPAVQAVREALESRLADVPGATVEDKRLTLTVHYRQTPSEDVPRVEDAVENTVESVADEMDADLRIVSGKQSLEVRPAIDWDKGAAVEHVRGEVPDDWATVYVGDDTTDEDAFAALGPSDAAVYVGTDDTPADYRVPSQAGVADFLELLAADVLGGE